MVKNIVLIVVFGFVAVMILDRLRRRQEKLQQDQKAIPTANESAPTHTGKFRVQQMLEKTTPKVREVPESSGVPEERELSLDDDAPLPDPFEKPKK